MNNRQGGGRRRGRNNNNGQRPQGNGRGGDQGNRIDSRARGNAAQLLEKYRNMARDAQMSGDRVMTEYYLQFADHYFRVLSDARNRQDEQRARFDGDGDERDGAQLTQSDDEAEDGDELDAIDMIGRAPRNRGNANANGSGNNGIRDYAGNREERPREDRQREDRQRDERPRDERPRDDRPREGGQRDGNRDYGRERSRDDRPRDERSRDDRPREDRPARTVQREARPPRPVEGEATRSDAPRSESGQREGGEERPRRPRRERAERFERNGGEHDEAPIGIDIAVLPPAIGLEPVRGEEADAAPAAAANDDAPPAPRKRGRPRKVVSESEDAAA